MNGYSCTKLAIGMSLALGLFNSYGFDDNGFGIGLDPKFPGFDDCSNRRHKTFECEPGGGGGTIIPPIDIPPIGDVEVIEVQEETYSAGYKPLVQRKVTTNNIVTTSVTYKAENACIGNGLLTSGNLTVIENTIIDNRGNVVPVSYRYYALRDNPYYNQSETGPLEFDQPMLFRTDYTCSAVGNTTNAVINLNKNFTAENYTATYGVFTMERPISYFNDARGPEMEASGSIRIGNIGASVTARLYFIDPVTGERDLLGSQSLNNFGMNAFYLTAQAPGPGIARLTITSDSGTDLVSIKEVTIGGEECVAVQEYTETAVCQ